MMIGALLFAAVALAAFGISIFTSLQLVQFLSVQAVNASGLSAAAAGFMQGGCAPSAFFLPLLWDVLLLLLFVLQHSLMASASWKRLIEALELHPIDRCLYLLSTCLCLIGIINHYGSLPALHLWLIDTKDRPWTWLFFTLLHTLSWLTIYASSLLVDFAELMGIKQVVCWIQVEDHPMKKKSPELQRLYRHMRHPGALSFMLILWCHPVMSLSRLFLALVLSLYLIFGHRVSKQDYKYVTEQLQTKSQSLREQFSLLG